MKKMLTGFAAVALAVLITGAVRGTSDPSQFPAQITIFEGIWPGSTRPNSRPALYPFSRGMAMPDAACIKGAIDGKVTDLQLQDANGVRLPSQFRVTGQWKDGCAEWVLVEGLATVTPGLTATQTLAHVAEGTGGNFGGNDMAVDNGNTLTINTGAATFVLQKGGFDLFHSVTVGTTQLVGPSTASGLFLGGPPAGQKLPGSVSCTVPCTNLYQSAKSINSTLSIEVNGPLHVTTVAQGDFVDATGAVYQHWTVRHNFFLNSSEVDSEIALRNADKNNGSDFAAAYKKFQFLDARLGTLLSGTLSYQFGNHTATPTKGTLTAGHRAGEYIAYTDNMQWPDWNMPNCNGHEGDKCVDSFIQRSAAQPFVYNQNGYQIVQDANQVGPAGTSGKTFSLYPQSWADISNASGAGVEIGAFHGSAFWPKSLQFENGGQEVRIGLWPDQSLYQGGGGIPYTQAWPYYSIHKVVFIFHDKPLANPADAFLDYQHYLIATPPWQFWNAAVDAKTGRPALGYFIPDPALEDAQSKKMNLSQCLGTDVIGHCLKDIGDPRIGVNMTVQRVTDVGAPGAGNQHDKDMSDFIDCIQRLLPGRCVLADLTYFSEYDGRSFPRSDFPGGWRGTVTTLAQAKQQLTPWGFPSVTSINGGMRDDACSDSCEHYHLYGFPVHYFSTGDPWALEQLETGVADYEMNTLVAYNNPAASQVPGHSALGPSRAYGHQLAMWASYALYRLARGHNDAALALAGGENALAFGVWPNLPASGYGEPLNQTYFKGCNTKPGTDGYLIGIGCLPGVSRVRGLHYGSTGANTVPVTLSQNVTFVRKAGIVTATSGNTTNFIVGLNAYVNQATPADFNGGPFKVMALPDGKTLVYAQAGPDETGKGGVIHGPNTRIQETMFSSILNMGIVAFNDAERTIFQDYWTKNFTVNGKPVTIGDLGARRLAYAVANGSQREATVNTGVEKTSGVGFYVGIDVRNSTPPGVTGGDYSTTCAVNTCGPIDNWGVWSGVWEITGGTKDLDGYDGSQAATFVAQKASNSGIMGRDYGGVHFQKLLKAMYAPGPRLVNVPSVTVPNPCTGACTVTWTPPGDAVPVDGMTYWLSYELTPVGTTPKTITEWLGFHRDCLVAMCGGKTTKDASDGSGSWEKDPDKYIPWFALQDVNAPVSGSSYTLTVPAGQVATVSLKYYSSTAK